MCSRDWAFITDTRIPTIYDRDNLDEHEPEDRVKRRWNNLVFVANEA